MQQLVHEILCKLAHRELGMKPQPRPRPQPPDTLPLAARCGGGGGDTPASIRCDMAAPGNGRDRRNHLGRNHVLVSASSVAAAHCPRRLPAHRQVRRMSGVSRIRATAPGGPPQGALRGARCSGLISPLLARFSNGRSRELHEARPLPGQSLRSTGTSRGAISQFTPAEKARARARVFSARRELLWVVELRRRRFASRAHAARPGASRRADSLPPRPARLAERHRGPDGLARRLRRQSQPLLRKGASSC